MSEPEPSFLGFNAFDTTAFCTAILVAWYSLIPNPTGRQSASDRAEYQIYQGWRTALVVIVWQLVLMIIVTIQQLRVPDVAPNSKGWLLALMIAPWAPLAGHLRDTLTSGARVRRMMKARLSRNELLAILRDRFKFGQRSIALPSVIFHASGMLPAHPVETLLQHDALRPYLKALEQEAMKVAQLDDIHSLSLGALWAMNQGSQPTSISTLRVIYWKLASHMDLMGRLWTTYTCDISIDVMPGVESVAERALYLDMVDYLQQGGTVSDELAERGLKRFCHRCCLATRCAVEMFLESSERGHTDLRAAEWLKHVGMDWRGNFERVIDVLWEACFMDGNALRVQASEDDKSPSYNDRSKVTTTKVMALIFVLGRSVVAEDSEAKEYRSIREIIRQGSFGRQWWTRYWEKFYEKMCAKKEKGKIVVDHNCRSVLKECARELVDEDVNGIITILLTYGLHAPLCGNENCFLHGARLVLKYYDEEKVK
eukprot:TRINITY_DN14402_c1_g3_i1.p2 TRINITY_DN14402_c1_g3~~TRINITY_DN14402_c1_g3_i1.p2  ORF type:complete len:483 (+),score=81.69 TRINITY_DN14402_c1_g3_i1:2282-3730(+)